jgi:hypothetical protein
MTDLAKPVRRRCREPFAHYHKRIVVALEPGDVIAMRLERTRTTYRATLAVWHARAEARRKREERKARTFNR